MSHLNVGQYQPVWIVSLFLRDKKISRVSVCTSIFYYPKKLMKENCIKFCLKNEIKCEMTFEICWTQFGKTYTWKVKIMLMGLRHIEMCKQIVEIYELPLTPEEFSKLQREKSSKIMLNAQLMPGAEHLIRHLHSHKIPFC